MLSNQSQGLSPSQYGSQMYGARTTKQNTCRNCGAIGHLYKSCNKPIMSFGIICYRLNEISNEIEYLMIQRRDSLAFMEFIRGKYDIHKPEYIKHLMSFMTETERVLLVSSTFNDLWNQVWYQPYMPKHTQEYFDARDKFHLLRTGIETMYGDVCMLTTLATLMAETTTQYTEPEWGFPKGRRRLREKDIDCGVREFCEETGFVRTDIELDPMEIPYEEQFFGTNMVKYRHVYYIARVVKNIYRDIVIDSNNPHQAREVRQVKWFSANEVIEHIREHNKERKQLFRIAHERIEKNLKDLA